MLQEGQPCRYTVSTLPLCFGNFKCVQNIKNINNATVVIFQNVTWRSSSCAVMGDVLLDPRDVIRKTTVETYQMNTTAVCKILKILSVDSI